MNTVDPKNMVLPGAGSSAELGNASGLGSAADFGSAALAKYSEILDLPHYEPDPVRHPRMSRRDRAAQFAPFAALTGFDESIEQTGEDHNANY